MQDFWYDGARNDLLTTPDSRRTTEGAMAGAILVVDDNEANMNLITAVLRTRRYELIPAMSGEAAIEVLTERQPALVLMDVQMPGMSGLDVARAVRAMPDKR